MDCPLCRWAYPPPHCHGLLTWLGDGYECDIGGPGCGALHPLRGQPDAGASPAA